MNIGERIKLIRGKTPQKKFASTIDIAQNTLGNYERGERTPNADVIINIAETYGVSFAWLLTGQGPMKGMEWLDKDGTPCEPPVLDEDTICDPPISAFKEKVRILQRENEELRKEYRELRQENRELNKENRQLLKDNGDLRVEAERLKARAAPDQDMHNEAHRKVG